MDKLTWVLVICLGVSWGLVEEMQDPRAHMDGPTVVTQDGFYGARWIRERSGPDKVCYAGFHHDYERGASEDGPTMLGLPGEVRTECHRR